MKVIRLAGVVLGLSAFAATGSAHAQDAPPAVENDVMLTFRLLETGSRFQQADSAMDRMIEPLRGVIPMDNYRILARSMLSGVASERAGAVRQRLAVQGGRTYELEAWLQPAAGPDEVWASVVLRDADTGATVIEASANLEDGETMVLGTGRPDTVSGTLVLVVSGEIEGANDEEPAERSSGERRAPPCPA